MILNAEPLGYSDEARRVLQRLGTLVEEPVAQEELAQRAAEADVLIVRLGLRVTREVMEAAPRLRAIVTATTGLDHVDLRAARERGVTVLSLQGEAAFLRTITATAEHTWALLLAVVRHVPEAFASVRRGEWDRDRFRGRDLRGRRLGIVGLGRIGERVAGYGRAFEMAVGAYDPYRSGWAPDVRPFGTLDALLRWSDVLSIHAPLDKQTRGLIGEPHLRLLPPGAIVLNTSRGGIVEEAALAALLASGHLAAAAVDVLAGEQVPELRERSPLLDYARTHANLLITPHLGGATLDSMARTEVFMAEKLTRFLERQPGSDS